MNRSVVTQDSRTNLIILVKIGEMNLWNTLKTTPWGLLDGIVLGEGMMTELMKDNKEKRT